MRDKSSRTYFWEGIEMVKKEKLVALDFQGVGESYYYDGEKLYSLADASKVAQWIDDLPKDTIVITEFGGSADGPALRIADLGLSLYRVPTAYEQKAREAFGISGRKKDAQVLYLMFYDKDWRGFFHEYQPIYESIVRINQLYTTYTKLIRDRVAIQLAITSTYRQAFWLQQLERGLDEFVKSRCADNPAFVDTTTEERAYLLRIKAVLEESELYQKVLQPIPGIGPRIAAGLIGITGSTLRFFAPDKPNSLMVAKWRYAEYAGLGGEAINSNLLATRRSAGQSDIGVPSLKTEAFFVADQFSRQGRTMLLWRKLKEFYTILDELLNSSERADLVFTPKNGNAESKGISPRELAYKRACRKIKEIFVVKYFFTAMYHWETGQLPDDFDAQARLRELGSKRLLRDQELITRHQPLRLAHLPYKKSKKGGKTAFGDWMTVCPLSLEEIKSGNLRSLALEQMIADINAEIAHISAKLDGSEKRFPNETLEHLHAALGRRTQIVKALKQDDLGKLKDYNRQLVWETRGIGELICQFIEKHVHVLRRDFLTWQIQRSAVVDPIEKEIEDLKQQQKDAELKASKLKKDLREAEKEGGDVTAAEQAIADADLSAHIAQLRDKLNDQKNLLRGAKKDFAQQKLQLTSGFRPDLNAVLNPDPRLQKRSKRDRNYVESMIYAIIEHRAIKGLWVD